ncbi:MAG: carboxypeptidase-like regulatory domain-containing protein, partial [Bacteroides sp.]
MSKKHYLRGRVLYLFVLLCLIAPLQLLAQSIQLKGTVNDSSNQPLIGASIVEQGTTNGIITDLDGHFTLQVNPQASIVISYVGYISQTIKLNGKKELTVTLKDNSQMLEETVVIGYGSMKKSDMTGAISSVDVEDLAKRATTNPAEALQGKIAGVNIQKAGGNAGA